MLNAEDNSVVNGDSVDLLENERSAQSQVAPAPQAPQAPQVPQVSQAPRASKHIARSVLPEIDFTYAHPELAKIRFLAILPCIAVLLLISVLVAVFSDSYITYIAYVCIAGFVAVFGWLLWLIPRQVANTCWAIDENAVYSAKGKMWQSVEMMPLARIQYVDHHTGPIQRLWGQSSINITDASSNHFEIDGIKTEKAKEICDLLMKLSADKLASL